jgi:hypothetical protein
MRSKKGNQADTKLLMREDLQVEVEEGNERGKEGLP